MTTDAAFRCKPDDPGQTLFLTFRYDLSMRSAGVSCEQEDNGKPSAYDSPGGLIRRFVIFPTIPDGPVSACGRASLCGKQSKQISCSMKGLALQRVIPISMSSHPSE